MNVAADYVTHCKEPQPNAGKPCTLNNHENYVLSIWSDSVDPIYFFEP